MNSTLNHGSLSEQTRCSFRNYLKHSGPGYCDFCTTGPSLYHLLTTVRSVALLHKLFWVPLGFKVSLKKGRRKVNKSLGTFYFRHYQSSVAPENAATYSTDTKLFVFQPKLKLKPNSVMPHFKAVTMLHICFKLEMLVFHLSFVLLLIWVQVVRGNVNRQLFANTLAN